jgi:hypothetical protein
VPTLLKVRKATRTETINLQDRIPPMDVGLAWRKSMEFSPAMEAFRSYFRQSYDLPNHAVTRMMPKF